MLRGIREGKEVKPHFTVRLAVKYLTKWYDRLKERDPLLDKFEAKTEIEGRKYRIIITRRRANGNA